MTLASVFSWVDRFESYLVENPEDKFSRARLICLSSPLTQLNDEFGFMAH